MDTVWLIKVNVALAVLYCCYIIFFGKRTTFQFRRFYIIGSLLFSWSIPLLLSKKLGLENTNTYLLKPIVVQTQILLSQNIQTTASLPIFEMIYWAGAILMAFVFCLKLFSIIKLTGSFEAQKRKGYSIIQSENIASPSSFFTLIMMPLITNKKEYELILAHEKVHVHQFHSIDVLLMWLFKIICWFNPFIYLLNRELKFTHECIADKIVAAKDINFYQKTLLAYHLKTKVNTLTNHFINQSNLKRRLMQFTTKQSVKITLMKAMVLIPLIGSISLLTAQTEIVTEEKVLIQAEKMPEFNGGMDAMINYLGKNIKYPADAKKDKTEGTVYVGFVITAQGEVEQVAIKRGVSPSIDEESIRVVKAMPKWKAGEQDGQKVSVQYTLPISFRLDENEMRRE